MSLNTATDTLVNNMKKMPGGDLIGQDATDLVAFHGATPVAQRSGAAQAAVAGTASTSSSPFGYSQAQADAIVTLLNEIRAALVAKGIIKGSA